jgi:hypothetical protein
VRIESCNAPLPGGSLGGERHDDHHVVGATGIVVLSVASMPVAFLNLSTKALNAALSSAAHVVVDVHHRRSPRGRPHRSGSG